MKRIRQIVLLLFVLLAVTFVAALVAIHGRGFSARGNPSALEELLARWVRRLAIPAAARDAENPVPNSSGVLEEARAHFADHCASCHGNDGSGQTEIGRNLYPPAPNMREEATQSLTDGELFYLIHNGVPFTGMPAWGGGNPVEDEASWKLVHFIRHLPDITPQELEEMKELNPKSVHERAEEEEIRRFLAEGEERTW